MSLSTALTARKVGIDTYRENVVYLRRNCPVYRAEGFQTLSKVAVRANGTTILAVLNVVDDERIVGELELGLSQEAFTQMQMREGAPVTIAHAEPPQSIASLKRKIAGERLSRDEFVAMVRDIAGYRYSKIELAAFVVAMGQVDLDRDEVLHLTEAMVGVGRRLDWHEAPRSAFDQ
jgi:thymidine phosphorylase